MLKWIWFRSFEAAVIAGGFSVAVILGIGAGWVTDNSPIYLENPVFGSHYVENPAVHGGEFLIVVRSLRRLDACAVDSGVWITTRAGDLLYPVATVRSAARPDAVFRSIRVAFRVPAGIPPGAYAIRSYPMCDRNPLSQVQQQLQDIPFEVVAP